MNKKANEKHKEKLIELLKSRDHENIMQAIDLNYALELLTDNEIDSFLPYHYKAVRKIEKAIDTRKSNKKTDKEYWTLWEAIEWDTLPKKMSKAHISKLLSQYAEMRGRRLHR